ncbi:MAG: flagellar motor protein MotB, partial [Fibrobacter sp.]|nr:flagellar motor protein MotB [Fibrobacter sp.]
MSEEKKCLESPPEGSQAYMTTFGDLMSLLLAFF